MAATPLQITLYGFIPAIAGIIAGICSFIFTFKSKILSFLQHFVAGILVGAVSLELLPLILKKGAVLSIGIGFGFGILVMLGIKIFERHLGRFPIGAITATAIDFLIDGILIGIAFLAGVTSGILIVGSLSFCAFAVVLSVAPSLKSKGISTSMLFFIIILVSLALPIGAFLGSSIVQTLPTMILVETLAFAVAALLYLGVEELLAEAHREEEDTLWISSSFFIGFLLILLVDIGAAS